MDMNKIENKSGKLYWRSLNELADTEEFREFVKQKIPNKAFEMLDGATRRRFLQIMAASFALAGLTGCRWPREKIVPYSSRPDGRVPGVPEHYATGYELGGVARGLLVSSFDGRPIKVDGNPTHPYNLGGSTTIDQASILELYDPDRSQTVRQHEQGQTFNRTNQQFIEFFQNHAAQFRANGGAGLYFLSEKTSSPTTERLVNEMKAQLPEAQWIEYDPVSSNHETVGTQIAFGQPARFLPRLDQARVLLSLDADLFGTHPSSIQLAREYIQARRPELGHDMCRFYIAESNYTNTGALADHRLAIPSTMILPFAVTLAKEVATLGNLQAPQELQNLLNNTDLAFADEHSTRFVSALAKDLLAHRGSGVIAAGLNQPPALHALAAWLNQALGNIGQTVHYAPLNMKSTATIWDLADAINNGSVQSLIILGGNPVYDAPADLNFAAAMEKIPTSIHLGHYNNETGRKATWHIPRAHFLESWGDARAYDGTVTTIQPLIEPLYHGFTQNEILALLMGVQHPNAYQIVQDTFRKFFTGEDFDREWTRVLHAGFIQNSQFQTTVLQVQDANVLNAVQDHLSRVRRPDRNNLEVVFVQDNKIYDGRFANNAWLQELPDFMTKVTWDNFAYMDLSTAQELGVKNGQLIKLNLRGRELTIAAFILPGHAKHSITLPLGYGRRIAGRVGNDVGFDTYQIRTTQAMYIDTGLAVEASRGRYPIATTMEHHYIDTVAMREREVRVREIIQEGTVEEYLKHPDFAKGHHATGETEAVHHPPLVSLWNEWEYEGYKWGMAVDLQNCIGCNACVVSCQAENNIPVVGKDEVINQREMHWLRIDRYFKGSETDPDVSLQPLACVHCENAPCESVCPVGATVHDSGGLNVMVYNRCVGTRYCSNNCPYKVRRFNFFNYHKNLSGMEKMVFNPEVTVRSRGVMEKCTYCVQRIEAAKIEAHNENRPIADGAIQSACQQACPTQAIVFGDLNNKESRVRQLHEQQRSYYLLAELNVKPRTEYLARVRNINPELAEIETTDEHTNVHHS